MDSNKHINLAVGLSVKSKRWKNTKFLWGDLVQRLLEPHYTNETFHEYLNSSKAEQGKIKDVGGYVGGYLRGSKRSPKNVVNRQLITLDIDYAHLNFWDDFCMQFSNAAVLHATHTYSADNPRYRLIIPLDREVSPDEYVAISRKLAGILDINLFDNTTFEINRLMFWPSTSKDAEYYAKEQKGKWLSADDILDSYLDWTDSSLWPTAKKQIDDILDKSKKQQNPLDKKGLIGIFCRSYNIEEVINNFLLDSYLYCGDNRYTYKLGSTSGGLLVYENMFAYSHHGTDPIGGLLCNSFDLLRIHKFGHLDTQAKQGKSNSFIAMEKFIVEDSTVRKTIAKETIKDAKYDFSEDINGEFEIEEVDVDVDWAKDLEINTKGEYLSSANNLNVIFANDHKLKDSFKYNSFDNKKYLFESMPWRKIENPEPIRDVDYSGIRNYIESIYGITGTLKIDDALNLEFEKKSFHPVKKYLVELIWDGTKRIDTLLIDYFGVKDSVYTREAIVKSLCGAVSRIFTPGCKFDLVLTLVGGQGVGKSTLVKKLGGKWFSDSFNSVHGKDSFEQLQGAWLMEIAELNGLRKAEVESIKHFISKQEDIFRPAYARTIETFKRQCVFFGTTNNSDFLTDPTGNRRFMPIDVEEEKATKSVFDLTQDTVDQIWAESVDRTLAGEKLYLGKASEYIALGEQEKHSKTDSRQGLVENYLNLLLPENWEDLGLEERQMFLEKPDSGTEGRDYVCIAEVWCECLEKPKNDMSRYKTRDINDILKSIKGWEPAKSPRNFKIYGKQRYYVKKLG